MREAMLWSIPLGRYFGVSVKIHWLFLVVALGLILRPMMGKQEPTPPPGACTDAFLIVFIMFLSVLLHEFGHCFGARLVDGDAEDILIWPLGGLAFVNIPQNPRAHFLTAAAGPLVNLLIFVLSGVCLGLFFSVAYQPAWSLLGYPGRSSASEFLMTTWAGEQKWVNPLSFPAILTRIFWVNWILFLFNIILVGFPMDSGRMFQSVVWNYSDYRQGTLWAVYAGYVCAAVVGIWSISTNELLALGLALFILQACLQQHNLLENGADESTFGYDFSQGFTSLERDHPEHPPALPRQSWWERWQKRRAARRLQREQETRQADERRMDSLLEKISLQGLSALSEDEKRFLRMYSDRYRNNS